MSKKILTIQDISCYGQCSTTVALPVLSAYGIETAILPSAILSTHTAGFTNFTVHDLTDEMPKIINHWISQGIKFDAIYSSDLQRTRYTAGAALEGREGLTLQISPRLRELHLGIWEDSTWGDLATYYPEQLYNYTLDTTKWSIPESEAFSVCQARMLNFIKEAARKNPGGNILCASHGFSIRALISAIENTPADKIKDVPFCGNTAITVINVDDEGNCTIEKKNDFSHLQKNDEFGPLLRMETLNLMRKVLLAPFDINRDLSTYTMLIGEYDIEVLKAKLLEEPRSIMTLLKDGCQIGIVELDIHKGEEFGRGTIVNYVLDERYRDMRLSRLFLGHACSVYERLGREKIVIEIPKDNWLDTYFKHYAFEDSDIAPEKGDDYKVMEYDLVI